MTEKEFLRRMSQYNWEWDGLPVHNLQTGEIDEDAMALSRPYWKEPGNPGMTASAVKIASRKEIEKLTDDTFIPYVKKFTRECGIHFFDEWKRDFVGSEFLIETVEYELEARKRLLYSDFVNDLFDLIESSTSLSVLTINLGMLKDKYLNKAKQNAKVVGGQTEGISSEERI